jgi:hypothetical protein
MTERRRAINNLPAWNSQGDVRAHELAGHRGGEAELVAMHDKLALLVAARPDEIRSPGGI